MSLAQGICCPTFVPSKAQILPFKRAWQRVLDMFMGFQHFAQNKVRSRLQERLLACVKPAYHPSGKFQQERGRLEGPAIK